MGALDTFGPEYKEIIVKLALATSESQQAKVMAEAITNRIGERIPILEARCNWMEDATKSNNAAVARIAESLIVATEGIKQLVIIGNRNAEQLDKQGERLGKVETDLKGQSVFNTTNWKSVTFVIVLIAPYVYSFVKGIITKQ